MEGEVSEQASGAVGVGLTHCDVHHGVVDIISRDEVLLVEANAVAILSVQGLWNGHVEEGKVVVGKDGFERVALVLPMIA